MYQDKENATYKNILNYIIHGGVISLYTTPMAPEFARTTATGPCPEPLIGW